MHIPRHTLCSMFDHILDSSLRETGHSRRDGVQVFYEVASMAGFGGLIQSMIT